MLDIAEPDDFAPADVNGLRPDSDPECSAVLRALLARNAVVCVRQKQPLTHAEFESIAELFGPIKEPVGRARDGSMFRYSPRRQVIDAGFVMTEAYRQEHGDLNFGGLDNERPGLFETYHCDDTYTEDPAQATVLHARQLPPSGGGPTHFIDMRAAWRQLDDGTRRRIAKLQVIYAYNNEGAFETRRSASGAADVLVDVTHPLVRTHPIARTKALFVDLDRARQVDGLPVQEGRDLLQTLQEHAERNAPTCHHDWRDHDVLVWDNASVQHKAGGNFRLGESRRFWRHMLAGPRPR